MCAKISEVLSDDIPSTRSVNVSFLGIPWMLKSMGARCCFKV